MLLKGWKRFVLLVDDGGAGTGGGAGAGDAGAGDGAGTGTGGAVGGEEMIPKARVQELIRQRVQETHDSYKDHGRYKGMVEKLQKTTGKDPEVIERELDAYIQQLEAQRAAGGGGGGMSPQAIQELDTLKRETQKNREENQEFRLTFEEEKLKANPLYSDLATPEVATKVRDHARKTGMSLEQSYWATQGPTRATQIQRETEARVKADYEEKMAHGGVLGDGGSEETKKLGLTPEQLGAAKILKMSPEEYAVLSKHNDIDSYRAHKAKQKAK